MTALTEFTGAEQADLDPMSSTDTAAAAIGRARVAVAGARAERAVRQARTARETRAQRLRDIGWSDQAGESLSDEAAVETHAALLRREGA